MSTWPGTVLSQVFKTFIDFLLFPSSHELSQNHVSGRSCCDIILRVSSVVLSWKSSMTKWPNPSVFGGEQSAMEDELCQQLKPSNSNEVLLLPLWVLATRNTWGHCWRQIKPHGWDSLIILPSLYFFLWSKWTHDKKLWEEKRCNGKRGVSVNSQDEVACVLVSVMSSGEHRKNTALGLGRCRFKWLVWLEQISNSVSLFSSSRQWE